MKRIRTERSITFTEAVLWTVLFYFLAPALMGLVLTAAGAAAPEAGDVLTAAVCREKILVLLPGICAGVALLLRREAAELDPAFPYVFPYAGLSVRALVTVLLLAYAVFDLAGAGDLASNLPALLTSKAATTATANDAAATLGPSAGAAAPQQAGPVLMAIAFGFVVPVSEEVLMRGILYRGLRTRTGFWLAAVLSSFVWALSHMSLAAGVTTFLAGLLLAFVYEKYRKLWVPVLLHILHNLMALPLAGLEISQASGARDEPGVLVMIAVAEALVAFWLIRRTVRDGAEG